MKSNELVKSGEKEQLKEFSSQKSLYQMAIKEKENIQDQLQRALSKVEETQELVRGLREEKRKLEQENQSQLL